MRAITSQTAAHALEISPKQLDNLLLRIGPGALGASEASRRQGRERRIPMRVLPELALTLEIISGLGLGVRDAHLIAASLCAANQSRRAAGGSPEASPTYEMRYLWLSADLEGLTAHINQRLSAAIETTVRAKRGRPSTR
jgi:hypothetical protein